MKACLPKVGFEWGKYEVLSSAEPLFSASGKSKYLCSKVRCKSCLTEFVVPNKAIKNEVQVTCPMCDRINIGDMFGELVVTSILNYVKPCGSSIKRYLVKCSCGKDATMLQETLERKVTCGKCDAVEVGMVFGEYTTLEDLGLMEYGNHGRRVHLWLCRCSCGEKAQVTDYALRNQSINGCRSCMGHRVVGMGLVDRVGDVSGTIKVLSFDRTEGGKSYWRCICDPKLGGCGRQVVYSSSRLLSNCESCGCLYTARKRELVSGENSLWWRGGLTPLAHTIRGLSFYSSWVSAVLERDNYTCQYSGLVGGRLNVHHIKPFAQILKENKIASVETARNCEDLWDMNNGITLAKEYHSPRSKNCNSFHKLYGTTTCTEADFYKWFETRMV